MTFLFHSRVVQPFDPESAIRGVYLRFFVALALICLIGLSTFANAAVDSGLAGMTGNIRETSPSASE
jgi:hypothetical protein